MMNKKDIKEYFNVPEGYFDDLHNNIMAQIDNMQAAQDKSDAVEAPTRRVAFFAVAWRMVAAAAVVAVMVLSTTVIFNSGDTKVADSALSDTSATVTSPEVIMAKSAPVAEKAVAVTKESIAEMPQNKTVRKPVHKAVVNTVPTPAAVAVYEAEDFAVDKVDEYLMIDDQMLHQMMVTEM